MLASPSWLTSSAEPRVRALLARICAAPGLHARFLNTLSLMEHIGSRKIMATQASGGALGSDTLQHIAEEARHAFFFKRQAEAAAGHTLSYNADTIMAGPQARAYMGRLDAHIARTAKGAAAYLYMSLVIELRAVWFYRVYQDVLTASGKPIRLTSLLAEENRHLQEMEEHLTALGEDLKTHLPGFTAYEEGLFGNLLTGLERIAA
ncbi:MAG TPA: hypothetical protein VGM26_08650 [Rhizomicrobium sp.]|jgi:hypothetical protein